MDRNKKERTGKAGEAAKKPETTGSMARPAEALSREDIGFYPEFLGAAAAMTGNVFDELYAKAAVPRAWDAGDNVVRAQVARCVIRMVHVFIFW